MRFISTFFRIAFILAVLSTAGCGTGFSPAEGVVTLDGAPLANATVVFQSPERPLATARTDKAGRFRVETGGIEGIKPGEYRVAVAAYQVFEGNEENAPELVVPEKYVQPDSSGLSAVIGRWANRGLNFKLTTESVTSN